MIVRQKAEFVVVVPARGGSKGVFRKNLRMLAGRPLLAWTITAVYSAPGQPRGVVVRGSRAGSCWPHRASVGCTAVAVAAASSGALRGVAERLRARGLPRPVPPVEACGAPATAPPRPALGLWTSKRLPPRWRCLTCMAS